MQTTVDVIEPVGVDLHGELHRAAARPTSLRGLRLGLLDNGKPNAAHVVAVAGERLVERFGATKITWFSKDVASRACPPEILTRLEASDAAIVGVGD